jgi:hypothetical protein
LSCCLRCIVAIPWCSRKRAACGRGLERVPNFEVWEETGPKESLSPAWIGRTPSPNCRRVSTFREASLTKRGDLVRRRQPEQGRCLARCPGARRNGGADPGAAMTRPGAWGGTKRGRRLTQAWARAWIWRGGRASSQDLAQGHDCL